MNALLRSLRSELVAGIAMAEDAQNAGLPKLAERVTTLQSPWFARNCGECRHKFREGDLVRLCPQCGTAYHDDQRYELRCWPQHFNGGKACTPGGLDRFSGEVEPSCDFVWSGELPEAVEGDRAAAAPPGHEAAELLATQFVQGLERVWRPFGEQKVEKVLPGSALVGLNCPWCRFRVRVGDWVVACPCGCRTYFHQDVFRHLTCWNSWNGVEGRDYCPNTGRSYRQGSNAG